jgi:GPH family glycoside/pentoside/hexuronide:cation symporter
MTSNSSPVLSLATAAAEPRSVPWAAKLFYGVGEIPITVTMVMFGLFAMFFYNSVMGLPGVLVGIGIAAGLVVDAVVDPYIGYSSDRNRGRLGRRHSFMLPGALAMGPCFAFLFSPPRGMGHAGLFLWLLTWSIIFRATSAVYRIPYMSFGAELTRDYDERTTVIAVRSLFGLAGTLAAAGLSFLVFFPATSDGTDPKLHYQGYPRMGLVFGAIMTATGLIACFGTLSQRVPVVLSETASSLKDFYSGFRLSMRNKAFRSTWFSFVVFFLAVVLNAVVAVNYFTWYARLHDGKALSSIQASFYIGALLGVVGWMAMARRGEKHRMYFTATLAMAGLLCLAFILVGPGRAFGAGNPLPFLIGHFIGGLLASAVWVLPASMMADVADQDELNNGQRREGIYFGILSFGEKIASGGALLLAGILLNFFVRLTPGAATQTATTIERLGMVYGPLPGLLLVAAALLIVPYKLDRRAVSEIQERLAERRQIGNHV